jgi:hypothetical protein
MESTFTLLATASFMELQESRRAESGERRSVSWEKKGEKREV